MHGLTREIDVEWTIPLLDKLLNSKKSVSAAGKSILNFIQFCQVWLQNIVKCGKYSPVKFANFVKVRK